MYIYESNHKQKLDLGCAQGPSQDKKPKELILETKRQSLLIENVICSAQ